MGNAVKEYMVQELADSFKNSAGFIVTNFSKMNVVDVNSLRRKLEQNSSRLVVAKNTLIKSALARLKWEGVDAFINGTTGIAVYKDDPAAAAKTLFDFAKSHEQFKIRGGIIYGEVIGAEKAKELSQLPGKDVLRAMVVMRMKFPITGLVNVLAGPLRGLVTALEEIKKKRADRAQ